MVSFATKIGGNADDEVSRTAADVRESSYMTSVARRGIALLFFTVALSSVAALGLAVPLRALSPLAACLLQLFLLGLFLIPQAVLLDAYKDARGTNLSFLARLYLHWTWRIFYNSVFLLLMVWGLSFLDQELGVLARAAAERHAGALAVGACFVGTTVAWMLAVSQAWALANRGLKLDEVARGALLAADAVVAGPHEQVQTRLMHYLTRLCNGVGQPARFKTCAAYPRFYPAQAPGMIGLYYPLGALELRLHLAPDGEATRIAASIGVRKLYTLEWIPNPMEALAALDQMRVNVFDPLGSEFALQAARERQERLRHQATEMQLRILQAQVEPHFLFNTMANLRHLYRTDIASGEDMLNHLISYLRGAMDDLRCEVSTVGKELDLALHYLAIIKIRMGERLSYSFVQHDEVGAAPFPAAMLISLIENAVKHGLRDMSHGELRITAGREDGCIRLSVYDNGPGFSTVSGTGLGLSNIRQRLDTIHGHRARLEVGALPDGGFLSSIVVPA